MTNKASINLHMQVLLRIYAFVSLETTSRNGMVRFYDKNVSLEKKNSFIEMPLIYNTLCVFKLHNLIGFDICIYLRKCHQVQESEDIGRPKVSLGIPL